MQSFKGILSPISIRTSRKGTAMSKLKRRWPWFDMGEDDDEVEAYDESDEVRRREILKDW